MEPGAPREVGPMLSKRVAMVGLAAVVVALSGCSVSGSVTRSTSADDVEKVILEQQAALQFQSADCPEALSADSGAVVTCTARAENGSSTVVTVTRGDGDNTTITIADNELIAVSTLEAGVVQNVQSSLGTQVTADCGTVERIPVDEGTTINCTAVDPAGSSRIVVATAHPAATDVGATFTVLPPGAAAPDDGSQDGNSVGGTTTSATVEDFVKTQFRDLDFPLVSCPGSLGDDGGSTQLCRASGSNGTTTLVTVTRTVSGGTAVTATIPTNEIVSMAAAEAFISRSLQATLGHAVTVDCGGGKTRLPVDEGTLIPCRVTDSVTHASRTVNAAAHPTSDDVSLTY